MSFTILAINPGSTSTKIAVYKDKEPLFREEIFHTNHQLMAYNGVSAQLEFRLGVILQTLKKHHFKQESLDAIVGRGGLLKPISGGTYKITQEMINDLQDGLFGEHASNLGALIANELAQPLRIPAYIVDPVTVDELQDVARVTGNKKFERISIFHALNQKEIGRKVAAQFGKSYEKCRFIIAHLGGGISVGAHEHGKVIDVNNALDGDGPFSPERSGSLPMASFLSASFHTNPTIKASYADLVGKGGIVSYLGTNDMRQVEKMIEEGNRHAALVFSAMAYQVAKEIGSLAPVLKGKLDAIILTGGLAKSKQFVDQVKERVDFLSEVVIMPGEDELEALSNGAWRVLSGVEKLKEY